MKGLMVCPKAKTCKLEPCEARKPHEYKGRCFCRSNHFIKCVPVKQEKRWKPLENDIVYYLNGGCMEIWCVKSVLLRKEFVSNLYKLGNCFKTRKQAREMKRRIEGILKGEK